MDKEKVACFAGLTSGLANAGQFLGIMAKKQIIEHANISFTPQQVAEVLYNYLVKNKRIGSEPQIVKLNYLSKDGKAEGIHFKSVLKEVPNAIPIHSDISVNTLEEVLCQEMLKSGEISQDHYLIDLKFNLSEKEGKQVLGNIDVKATLLKPNIKPKF